MITASLLTIGSEVLDGRVLNTNAQYLGVLFDELGIPLSHTHSCDDIEEEVGRCLGFLADSSRVVIVTGGLGPTTDDITREAVAQFVGVPLERSEEATTHLRTWYAARGRSVSLDDNKQTLLPKGSFMIPNPAGSAPGFITARGSTWIACLPGVPHELKRMAEETLVPFLHEQLGGLQPLYKSFFRLFGLPESEVNDRIKPISLPTHVALSYRAAFPEVHVLLKSRKELSPSLIQEVRNAIGVTAIVTEDPERSLVDEIIALLKKRNAVLSIAESCTGGLLGGLLTSVSGSSDVFAGGVVSYDNKLKAHLLGVPHDLLTTYGAVSAEVAEAMAKGALQFARIKAVNLGAEEYKNERGSKLELAPNASDQSMSSKNSSTSYSLSVTGIAGPEGGTPAKPVGTFFLALATESGSISRRCFFSSSRDRIRTFAAYSALDLLRQELLTFKE